MYQTGQLRYLQEIDRFMFVSSWSVCFLHPRLSKEDVMFLEPVYFAKVLSDSPFKSLLYQRYYTIKLLIQ
jgi:hypothetical protein